MKERNNPTQPSDYVLTLYAAAEHTYLFTPLQAPFAERGLYLR
jgi:hypothetical protein